MSYLAKITPTQTTRSADDFQCGWSVMWMLAELSMQSPTKAAKRPSATAGTPKLAVARPTGRADVSCTERV